MPLPCFRTNCTQLPEWAIQYTWRYVRHDQSNRAIRTRAVPVEWRYVSYKLHYIPSSTVRTKRTVRDPEQSEKLPFRYKGRRISHSSPHFLNTMKNGIHVDQRDRNDCSRHVQQQPLKLRKKKKKKEKRGRGRRYCQLQELPQNGPRYI